MYKISIYELPGVIDFLHMRQCFDQYKKRKCDIQSGIIGGAYFKKRQPISKHKYDQVFYFRINRQYRALLRYKDGVYVVYEIDDHQ